MFTRVHEHWLNLDRGTSSGVVDKTLPRKYVPRLRKSIASSVRLFRKILGPKPLSQTRSLKLGEHCLAGTGQLIGEDV